MQKFCLRTREKSRTTVLKATFFELENSASLASELEKGDILVIFSKEKNSRPWIATYIGRSISEGSVKVQWMKKEKSNYVLDNRNGQPYTSEVPEESIMFSNVLDNVSPTGDKNGPFTLSPYMKRQILNAYKEKDSCI